jgi:O-antigen/teichoic acid export membrane protein
MKELVQRISKNSNYEKIIEWSKLISITGLSQLIIQSIGFISGILVIRLLSTQEYGYYTLANTMLGTMILLADGGISTSVLAQGGKVWSNREKLGSVLVTGFSLRKKFGVASLIIAIPLLLYLLRLHNTGWLTAILIIASIIPAFFTALSSNLLTVGPMLHQHILPLQKVHVKVSACRLMMLLLTLFVFPWSFIAILSASLPQLWGNLRLHKISTIYANWKQKPDPIIEKEILVVVKRILPGSIYYCLSSQITIWLISIFGTTASVAQIGALGRLAMMLGFFSAIFGALIVPRFARLANNKELILKRFLQIQMGLIALFLIIVLLVSLFPTQILWILGKDYSGLEKELVLSVAGSCISLFAGLLFNISTSRTWVINPLISIPIKIVTIICGAFFLNLTSLTGILEFNIFLASTEVIIYFVYSLLKINRV